MGWGIYGEFERGRVCKKDWIKETEKTMEQYSLIQRWGIV